MKELEIVSQHIDTLVSESVDLMKNLVEIQALGPINGGDGEHEKAEYLKGRLKEYGFKNIEEYPAADPAVSTGKRPNLVVRVDGKNPNKTVWIMAHLDVVPAGDLQKWNTEPFKAIEKNGRIYGRGTEDNHQGLVSGVVAARAFLEKGIQPSCNLGLLLVADEETGSTFGLDYILKNHPELFGKDDLLIVPDAGEPDSTMIEVAEKSIIWFVFKILGKQVHASMPAKGINAFSAGSHLVVALEELRKTFGSKNDVFDPPESTFEPTKKEANVPNVNTIPGDDIFHLDCRVLPEYSLEDVKKSVRSICDRIEADFNVRIEIDTTQDEQAAPETASDAEVVVRLQKAIKDIYGVEARPMGIGGGTVAAHFRKAGFPTAVWSTIQDLAHQPNEFCIIDSMMNDAKVFAHVCLEA